MAKKDTVIKVPPGSSIKIVEQEEKEQKDLANSSSGASHDHGRSTSTSKNANSEHPIENKDTSLVSSNQQSSNSKGISESSMKSESEKSDEPGPPSRKLTRIRKIT